ncbi:MAG: helix-turn-helix transcriptional regulator [Clostridia bacterium]|nr:helix-turn-helix transcriptional regulator [Clostridia bacterium]
MIHRLNALSLTEKLRESLQDSGDDLPFAAVESDLTEYANNCASWHWHDFVELGWVVDGRLECSTPSGAFTLSPGEGYFVNANTLHLHRMAGEAATFRVIQFVPSLLAGSGSLYARYIAPVERCPRIESLALRRDDPVAGRALDDIIDIFALAAREPTGYELRIMEGLFRLWSALYALAAPMLAAGQDDADAHADRVKTMLTFIHTHFDEPLTVADIAAAASVSEREAFRSFRKVLDVTPTGYLLRHRVNSAARMLAETRMSVTEISLACGFSSPSYLCKVFHDLNGVSPRDYRRGGAKHGGGA